MDTNEETRGRGEEGCVHVKQAALTNPTMDAEIQEILSKWVALFQDKWQRVSSLLTPYDTRTLEEYYRIRECTASSPYSLWLEPLLHIQTPSRRAFIYRVCECYLEWRDALRLVEMISFALHTKQIATEFIYEIVRIRYDMHTPHLALTDVYSRLKTDTERIELKKRENAYRIQLGVIHELRIEWAKRIDYQKARLEDERQKCSEYVLLHPHEVRRYSSAIARDGLLPWTELYPLLQEDGCTLPHADVLLDCYEEYKLSMVAMKTLQTLFRA
jgi:hypothetical protein